MASIYWPTLVDLMITFKMSFGRRTRHLTSGHMYSTSRFINLFYFSSLASWLSRIHPLTYTQTHPLTHPPTLSLSLIHALINPFSGFEWPMPGWNALGNSRANSTCELNRKAWGMYPCYESCRTQYGCQNVTTPCEYIYIMVSLTLHKDWFSYSIQK